MDMRWLWYPELDEQVVVPEVQPTPGLVDYYQYLAARGQRTAAFLSTRCQRRRKKLQRPEGQADLFRSREGGSSGTSRLHRRRACGPLHWLQGMAPTEAFPALCLRGDAIQGQALGQVHFRPFLGQDRGDSHRVAGMQTCQLPNQGGRRRPSAFQVEARRRYCRPRSGSTGRTCSGARSAGVRLRTQALIGLVAAGERGQRGRRCIGQLPRGHDSRS